MHWRITHWRRPKGREEEVTGVRGCKGTTTRGEEFQTNSDLSEGGYKRYLR